MSTKKLGLVIENDVPLTKIARKGGVRGSKYPWAEMSAGQSVLIPAEMAKAARASVAAFGHLHGLKFACRVMEEGGLRVYALGAREASPETMESAESPAPRKRGRKAKSADAQPTE